MDALIAEAAEILRRGGLVAFPTETVYGLGADAANAAAVRKIFQIKGRPATNPLICHVADASVARRYAGTWPDSAEMLAKGFWPGPLTLVLPKTHAIVPEVTAGLDTVGLRAPDHPLALELLRKFDGPIAAPSANRSSRVSPTTARHVRDDLGNDVDLILDGGPCRVGIESTVLDLSGDRPTILRPGGVARESIEAVIGTVGWASPTPHEPARSPGQQEIHYAPQTPAYRFETSQRGLIQPQSKGRDNGIMAVGTIDYVKKWGPIVAMPRLAEIYAQNFYAVLRELDAMSLAAIYIEVPPDQPAWAAVRDRIARATRPLPGGSGTGDPPVNP
jgi:L-threonylcarbamoyladenylate synthase